MCYRLTTVGDNLTKNGSPLTSSELRPVPQAALALAFRPGMRLIGALSVEGAPELGR